VRSRNERGRGFSVGSPSAVCSCAQGLAKRWLRRVAVARSPVPDALHVSARARRYRVDPPKDEGDAPKGKLAQLAQVGL
jgi:hypothetical protein